VTRLALALGFVVLLGSVPAHAQQGGADLRLGTGAVLDFGGSARVDSSGPAKARDEALGATPGLRLHAEYDLSRWLALGAAARVSWWKAGGYGDNRNALFDVGPRFTGHFDFRDLRFYAGLSAGLAVSNIQNDAVVNLKSPAYGFGLTLFPGIEYWFAERVGVFFESGWSGHWFKHQDPLGGDTRVALGQVVCQVGATFALSEPLQGKPRRDAVSDDRRARRNFEAGKKAYENQRYARALNSFEHAYALSPRPLMLYNIAQTEDQLGKRNEARGHYKLFLAELPGTPLRSEIEGRIVQINAEIGPELTAASPEQAALVALAAERRNDASFTSSAPSPVRSERVIKKWWFWTAVGGVLAAGITTGVLAGMRHDAREPSRYDGSSTVIRL
jgi:tetratricopeptide (TPR) repeat protein